MSPAPVAAMSSRRLDRLVQGAAIGFEAWLWYGVAEYLLCTVGPILFRRYSVAMTAQWRGTVLLFAGYAFAGCVLGLATALLVDRQGNLTPAGFSRRIQTVLSLTIIGVFGVNVAATREIPQKLAEILAASLIAGAVIWSSRRTDPDRFFWHPAAVAVTLVVSGRLACGLWADSPAFQAVSFTLGATLGMIVSAAVAIRLASWFRSRSVLPPALAYALDALAIIAIVFGPGILSLQRAEAETSLSGKPSAPGRPNIILVTMDTARADHMGLYGYARENTPNLAALRKDATLYTNSIAASSMTLTSHASIFTGLYPQSHGAFMLPPDSPTGRPLATSIPTAASILASAGYQTMAVAANWYYLNPLFGLVRGFQYTWTPRPEVLINRYHDFLLRNRLRRMLPIAVQDFDRDSITGEEVNRQALALLDRAKSQHAPFFLFLNYMDAHFPYLPPPSFDTLYPGLDPAFPSWDTERFYARVNTGRQVLQPAEVTHLVSQYDGGIAYIDSKLGELVEQLKRSGQYDRTMIVISSDHGEALGERGKLGHNLSSYQNQIRVPLLIKYPRSAQSGTVDSVTSHVDLLPTMLDAAGLPIPQDLPGMSLLHPAPAGSRLIVSERHESAAASVRISYAMLSGSSKLIYSPDGKPEFYDLSNDPNEDHDLYRPDIASHAALRDRMQEWIRITPKRYLTQAPIDPAELKRLKSLGYVQ